ncbi:MAG: hypothetical protein ACR2MX_15985 [Cyclobacteriaceae bacterium]
MMKKIYTILLAIFLFSGVTMAQVPKGDKAKIEAAKIALISNRLDLSPDQAKRFWPMYNEFAKKRGALRSDMATKARELSDEQRIKLALEVKQRELDLEKNYSQKMLDVISAKQVVALRKAEGEFREMLIRRIQQQKIRQQRRDQVRKRIEDRRRD